MDDPDRTRPDADRLINYARALFADPTVNGDTATPAWVPEWDPANMGPPLSAYDPFLWHGDPAEFRGPESGHTLFPGVPALTR